MSQPLIRRTNADEYVPRWLHPGLAEALELLPEYGELTITVVNGQLREPVTVTRTHLLRWGKRVARHQPEDTFHD